MQDTSWTVRSAHITERHTFKTQTSLISAFHKICKIDIRRIVRHRRQRRKANRWWL